MAFPHAAPALVSRRHQLVPLRASVHHGSPAKSVAVTRLHQPAVDSGRDEFVTPADVGQARAGASPSLKNDVRKALPVAQENECIRDGQYWADVLKESELMNPRMLQLPLADWP